MWKILLNFPTDSQHELSVAQNSLLTDDSKVSIEENWHLNISSYQIELFLTSKQYPSLHLILHFLPKTSEIK